MQFKRLILPGAATLAVITGVAGASAITSLTANADTSSSGDTSTSTTTSTDSGTTDTTATTTRASTTAQADQNTAAHTANGITETVLTGDTYTKAVAAAQTAEPGATVIRAETDAEGATFEVHMQKSDGSMVTVKLDASFNVTSTEAGPNGAPSGQSSTSSTTQG